MKKTYITPAMRIIEASAESMIASSVKINTSPSSFEDAESRGGDFFDDED